MAESPETSSYPGTLDTWVTLDDKEDLAEVSDINKIKAAIEAVQGELGTDPAGTLATLKARLAIMMHTNGAIVQGTSFPVSPTPVEGQIFYRTDENTPYVYNGSDWIAFVAPNFQVFTSTQSLPIPGGINYIVIHAIVAGGGGGGGARDISTHFAGGGGAGGGTIRNVIYKVTPLSNLTITVGTGGAGGGVSSPGANGTTGGNSSISGGDYTLTASGGAGGQGGQTGANGTGGSGYAGTADITQSQLNSQTSALPIRYSPAGSGGNGDNTGAGGGPGGASMMGLGGAGAKSNTSAAVAGIYPGGGGGGGDCQGGGSLNITNNGPGASGGSGVVIISW